MGLCPVCRASRSTIKGGVQTVSKQKKFDVRARDDAWFKEWVAKGRAERRAQGLPDPAIDWDKLFAAIEAERARGVADRDIDWERIFAEAAGTEAAVTAAPSGCQREMQSAHAE